MTIPMAASARSRVPSKRARGAAEVAGVAGVVAMADMARQHGDGKWYTATVHWRKRSPGAMLCDCQRTRMTASMTGMVASSQRHASDVGARVLREGGTAADACVAMDATLHVTEPASTSLGGDMFAL